MKLSEEERDRLNALIQKGKSPIRQVLKARILLKADASEAEGTANLFMMFAPLEGGRHVTASCTSTILIACGYGRV